MTEDIYERLAGVLDSLPNGFPRSQTGVELQLLKKIFPEEDAELFCDLKLRKETSDEIAARTGRDAAALEERLTGMWNRGLLECDPSGPKKVYGLVPWILGLYELQLKFIDEEFARLHAQYIKSVGPFFLAPKPQIMQVVPIEKELTAEQHPLPYESASQLIERSQSFAVRNCICKVQTSLLKKECKKPREVCISMSEKPGYFDNHPLGGRTITKQEAYDILDTAEKAGLIHMTGNIQNGNYFLCNCCGCCCVQMIAAKYGMPGTVNAHFYAEIDPEKCQNCGTCQTERCQIRAIDAAEDRRVVNRTKCIGCGLCASTCPNGAIRLVRKPESEQDTPPADEMDWYRAKARVQKKDISRYE